MKTISLVVCATCVALTSPVLAQDQDDPDAMMSPHMLDEMLEPETPIGEDAIGDALRELPDGVARVRTPDGEFVAPYESIQACSDGWCGMTVINSQSGRVLFSHNTWQPGVLETGYGDEVVVVEAQ